jgi:hypothetical protein
MFNPTARAGDAEWRVRHRLGRFGSGESRTSIRSNPQRLDTLVGKILRIVPTGRTPVDERRERQRRYRS